MGIEKQRRYFTDSQALGTAALSFLTTFTEDFIVERIVLHFSGNVTQTVTISLDALPGANWDTVLNTISITTGANAEDNTERKFMKGDGLLIGVTNSGTPAVTVYAEVMGRPA